MTATLSARSKDAEFAQNLEQCVPLREKSRFLRRISSCVWILSGCYIVHGIFYNVYRINEAFSSSPFTHYFDFCAFFALYVSPSLQSMRLTAYFVSLFRIISY
jgi:hypothetical protein